MQFEIIKYLEKQKEPKGVSEIASALKEDKVKVSKAIKKMLKYHEICCIEIDRHQAKIRFHAKKRTRLYSIDK